MITVNDSHTNPNLAQKPRYNIRVPGIWNYTGSDVVWVSDFRIRFSTDDGATVEISSRNGFVVTTLPEVKLQQVSATNGKGNGARD